MITKGRNRISHAPLYLAAGTIISLSAMTAPARAGFNWTPPPPPPKASPAPDANAVPLPPVEADNAPPAPVTASAPAPAKMAGDKAWMPQEAAVQQAPSPPAVSYKDIRGFGKDIPLAIAMNQIVPKDYAYSFAPEVNTGISVSWQGDRPWNVVLKDALEPAGLMAVIKDSNVRIEKWNDSGGTDTSASAPAVTASAPAAPSAHYSTRQLAAIGADTGNYHPSYPRHHPKDMAETKTKPAEESHSSWWPWHDDHAATADAASAKNVSPSSQGGQPTPIADKMEQQPAQASNGMTWQPAPAGQKTAPPAAANINTVSTWQATRGRSLHDTLSAWCDQSGVNLIWQANKDYKLPQTMDTKGTFTDAVLKLLTAYNNTRPRPVGQLHPNLPNGPPVLVINNEAGA